MAQSIFATGSITRSARSIRQPRKSRHSPARFPHPGPRTRAASPRASCFLTRSHPTRPGTCMSAKAARSERSRPTAQRLRSSRNLGDITGIAYGPDGNLHAADIELGAVYRVTMSGVVTTIADQNDNLGFPWGIAVDSFLDVYVADWANARISVIDPSGTVSTFAGTGIPGYSDGPAATSRLSAPPASPSTPRAMCTSLIGATAPSARSHGRRAWCRRS